MKNYWNEFEYNKLKLLENNEKVNSILDVCRGRKCYDEYFPISVDIHLTNACNLKCSWCTDKELRHAGKTMSEELACKLLREFSATGTGVTLEGGGEPTLHKNFFSIVDYACEHGVDLGLITNGTMDISEYMYKFKWVRVSLDSTNANQYKAEKGIDKFDTVICNLKKYAMNRNPEKTFLGVGYVITKRNLDGIDGLIDLLDSINVDYIYFRPVEEASDILPSVDDMINLKKSLIKWTERRRIRYLINIYDRVIKDNNHLPCVAHSLTSIIHADGTVNLCEKRRHDEIELGNVNEKTFSEIWNSNKRKIATNKLLCPDCQNGCDVCRVTGFNEMFWNLINMNTKSFI